MVLVAIVLASTVSAAWKNHPMIYTFDTQDELNEWVIAGDAAIEPFSFYSTPNALRLEGSLSYTPASGSRLLGPGLLVQPGTTYMVSARLNADLAVTKLTVRIQDGVDTVATFVVSVSDVAAGWQPYDFGPFVNTGSAYTTELQVFIETSSSGIWLVDDIEIVEVSGDVMKKWSAISAAIKAMKDVTITRNYNNDLGSRVYTRLFTPQEQRDVALPYACIPVDQEAEKIEYEGFQFQSTWRLTGHAFFKDNPESDPLDSAGATSAAKFRDDLIRAFMADPDLGNTVKNCEVTTIETSAGVVDDGVSEVIFTVEFQQYGGAADLAAS